MNNLYVNTEFKTYEQPQSEPLPQSLEDFLVEANKDLGKRNFLTKYPMANNNMENAKISCAI